MEGKTSVLINEKDLIIQNIVFDPIKPFTKEEVISKYGDDFVEKYQNDSICFAVEKSSQKNSINSINESEVSIQNNLNPPNTLVFPKIGIYASLSRDGK